MTTTPNALGLSAVDEVRSEAAADRLLEESWTGRSRRLPRRERVTELIAALLFLACVLALSVAPGARSDFDPGAAALLVGVYVAVATIEFPLGAGNVVPTQLVLVPMLVLLPPAAVPLAVAAGLLLAKLVDRLRGRGSIERVLFSLPDAWHAIGPALVVVLAGASRLDPGNVALLAAAFASCCAFDAGSALAREAAARGIAPALQIRVLALVWIVDACLLPIGVLDALAAQRHLAAALLVLPPALLLGLLARDRRMRIEQAQRRLVLAVGERSRLQLAVRHMGDAFAARLDFDGLVDIVLRGSVHALDADAGWLALGDRTSHRLPHEAPLDLVGALRAAGDAVRSSGRTERVRLAAGWAVGMPLAVAGPDAPTGSLSVVRRARPFREDEIALLGELVARAQAAAADILGYHELREQAVSDPLTGLGNRRKLSAAIETWRRTGPTLGPRVLMLLDLDGFKHFNDTFGHQAGDALLERLGARLAATVAPFGEAFRLGGDEFCALLDVDDERLDDVIAAVVDAPSESGEGFAITASYGVVLIPHEADGLQRALQLADGRMYARKQGRVAAGQEAREVLMRTMHAKQASLERHSDEVAQMAVAVARRLGMGGLELDEVARTAELHDVGKVGIPDAILNKPGALDEREWASMHEHTVLGERILDAVAALRPVARSVRSTHERWDGTGYPDGLRGHEIPRAARIVAVCDAYEAMTSDRVYRKAISTERAREELRAMAGTQFDPEVVAVFLEEIEAREAGVGDVVDLGDSSLLAVIAHVRTLLAQPRHTRADSAA